MNLEVALALCYGGLSSTPSTALDFLLALQFKEEQRVV